MEDSGARVIISLALQIKARNGDALHPESRFDGLRRVQTARQQARRDQQHQAYGHLSR